MFHRTHILRPVPRIDLPTTAHRTTVSRLLGTKRALPVAARCFGAKPGTTFVVPAPARAATGDTRAGAGRRCHAAAPAGAASGGAGDA